MSHHPAAVSMQSHACLMVLSETDLERIQGAGRKKGWDHPGHGHARGHGKKDSKNSDLQMLLGGFAPMQSLLGQLNISIINFFGVQNAAASVVQANAAYGAMQ
jgi:hypothetical protein